METLTETLTLREMDGDVVNRLRDQARLNRRSLEAEPRAILTRALPAEPRKSLIDFLMEIPPGDAHDDEDFARYQ
ncbi:FitA-like ribbon-helix-helix domain-containing protein [Cupriavidus campinensis]